MVLQSVKSMGEEHLKAILSNKSAVRTHIDAKNAIDDNDLLAEIGYKAELKRTYSTLEVFGIAFSIMGLLPSISTTIASGLMGGPSTLVWGWLLSGCLILFIGLSMSWLASSLPTSGGLYYWTNYYAPDSIRVPLSFFIGCSNTLATTAGLCSINYGFATEILSAVYINRDGDFLITNARIYGVFAACVVSHIGICCLASAHASKLQTFSVVVNSSIVILFIIAMPIAGRGHFNDAKFIFGNIQNFSDWPEGWTFMLGWMPAIWTIGAFDSCVHMSEEAKNASRAVPIGIIGSITVCSIFGWIICIISVAVVGDLEGVLTTPTGQVMAQIIYDTMGKKWAVAFMSLISFGQYLMGASILTAASRQIWAFARDDGLPFVYDYVKVVNPTLKVPIRATVFGGCLSLLLGLLVLIGPVAANALFSLGVASIYLAWGMPVLLVMTSGRKKFRPGPLYPGDVIFSLVNWVTIFWISYVILMCMFPSVREVDKESMNYTAAINGGCWILSILYYYTYGYKIYSGPKSNLGSDDPYADAEVLESTGSTSDIAVDIVNDKEMKG